MKYEYKIIRIEETAQQTERELNRLANQRWKVVCAYAFHTEYIILVRELK